LFLMTVVRIALIFQTLGCCGTLGTLGTLENLVVFVTQSARLPGVAAAGFSNSQWISGKIRRGQSLGARRRQIIELRELRRPHRHRVPSITISESGRVSNSKPPSLRVGLFPQPAQHRNGAMGELVGAETSDLPPAGPDLGERGKRHRVALVPSDPPPAVVADHVVSFLG
jgi:hypothetical protein